MSNKETDPIRENRIDYEIVVDAYDESERAMGWYYYLQDKITFPFLAIWKKTNKKTGAIATKEIEVIGMASEEGVWQRFVSKKDTSPEILFRQWFQTQILIISN